MEPVSATLGIVSATVTLAGLALTIGKTLTAAIKFNSQSRPQIYALISACKGIEVAWNRISTWLETYSFSENEGDGSFLNR